MKKFTIEIRETCKVCGGDLPNSRYRTYCSAKCRKKFYNQRDKEKLLEWQRIRRAKQKQQEEDVELEDDPINFDKWSLRTCSNYNDCEEVKEAINK